MSGRAGFRARRLAAAGVVAALAAAAVVLAGCSAPPASRAATPCPDGLAGAVSDRAVQGGTPTARVVEASAAELGTPALAHELAGACVLRITPVFRGSFPLSYQVITPGGRAEALALTSALRRDGWSPADRGTASYVMPGDGHAEVDVLGPRILGAVLPPGVAIGPDSPYAKGAVVLALTRPGWRDGTSA